MFRPELNRDIHHISLAQSIDLLAVVPATANILGKMAHGIADDFLSTLYLSNPAPVLIAPAMNVEMWRHAAVRANVETLRGRGHHFVNPESGMLACGVEGEGRLAAVDVIVDRILDVLAVANLAGLKVLVTAGPTVEDIDPIRFISNRSSGKMGMPWRRRHGNAAEAPWFLPRDLRSPRGWNWSRCVRRMAVRSRAYSRRTS